MRESVTIVQTKINAQTRMPRFLAVLSGSPKGCGGLPRVQGTPAVNKFVVFIAAPITAVLPHFTLPRTALSKALCYSCSALEVLLLLLQFSFDTL